MAKTKAAVTPKGIVNWRGRIHEVPGFRTASLHCGIKTAKNKPPDIALACADTLGTVAGAFTQNRVCAAPVKLCREHLKKNKNRARAVIINAGNANACTGEQGRKDARRMAELAASGLGCQPHEIMVFSTGIIGHLLPMEKVEAGVKAAVAAVLKKEHTGDFARGIMTTDIVPKTASAQITIGGKAVHISGACKGVGMLAPNMATMLGVIATDAAVAPNVLQAALLSVVDETFNCVTVDGDTSTNDSVVLFASGKAGNTPVNKSNGADYDSLVTGLLFVCDSLARQIAADGEGATHTITLYVGGTKNDSDARKLARTIAESPLVKTAIAGNDPNWGRIMAAAGRSGVVFDPDDATLTVCGHELFTHGQPTTFDKKTVAAALTNRDVSIVLLVGEGPGRSKFYTCDFTHGYISINADYHT